MKPYNMKHSREWVKKHPILARIAMLLCVPFVPLLICAYAIWEDRKFIKSEIKETYQVIFSKWEF